jgi:HD-like signal output (HDOD) protein
MPANSAIEKVFLDELYGMVADNSLILPTLPEMALRIRDLAEDDDTSLADISKAISSDPALAARVVQVANSPAFRTRTTFNSVDMAVKRLGGNMIKNIVTSMVMEQLFQSTTEVTDRKLRNYWHHATEVSQLAMEIAQFHRHLAVDQAMLAGLIHDIGVLPIISLAEEFPELLRNEAQLDRLLRNAHTAVGTAILKDWHFSDEMIAVCEHHEDLQYHTEGPAEYVELIIAANMLSGHKKADMAAIAEMRDIPAFDKLGLADLSATLAQSA